MALTQARTMPGVMELLPTDQIAFQRMLDTIRRNFERFGFLPIETPVMEFSDVLLTKQGGETERQVYFVQSTGALEQGGKPDLALRFDLTVPLARYVAEHEHELSFPFRRYQIQRVYRGERAQRGRFREFYQCDIDVIGKDQLSVRYDAEMPAVIYSVFKDLDFGPFTIQINNRKLMRGFLESLWHGRCGEAGALCCVRSTKSISAAPTTCARRWRGEAFGLSGSRRSKICSTLCKHVRLRRAPMRWPNSTRSAAAAIRSTRVLPNCATCSTRDQAIGRSRDAATRINLSIARGLDYYTGTVYETTLNDHPQIGSICSGGRYDNLAANYTKSHLPGVGISIGATRLFYQLREANLLPPAQSTVKVLVTQMDEAQLPAYLDVANQLRSAGIATEVVLDGGKLAKQFKYADRAGIRFVIVLGSDEIAKGTVTVKDMRKQDQFEVARADLVKTLRVELEQAEAMPQ